MDIITYIIMKQKMKKQSKGNSITNTTYDPLSYGGVSTKVTVEKEED